MVKIQQFIVLLYSKVHWTTFRNKLLEVFEKLYYNMFQCCYFRFQIFFRDSVFKTKNWNFNQPQSPLPSLNSRNHRTVQICVTTSSSYAYVFRRRFHRDKTPKQMQNPPPHSRYPAPVVTTPSTGLIIWQ